MERALVWHKFLGFSTIILSIDLWVHSEYNTEGLVMEIALIGLVIFSIPPIRRKSWEFFIRMHWVLIIVLFIISILHDVPEGYVGISMFFIDVLMR